MQTINGVPPSQVGRVVQDFIDNGAVRVVVELDDEGTYTISAQG